ncbi:MAG: biotin/lipoyl-binding protein, partial [Planctomycetes bacterium]|nr:biotin/lipoyl-binding protein [Planctomycetota bacterium]
MLRPLNSVGDYRFHMDNPTRRAAEVPLSELVGAARKPGAAFASEDLKSFLQQLLNSVAESFGGVGGAAWLIDNDGMSLAAKLRFQEPQSPDDDDKRERHRGFLITTAVQGKTRYVDPGQIAPDLECENPTEYAILVVPLAAAGKLAGILEFFFKDQEDEETRSRLLHVAASIRSGAEDFLMRFMAAQTERDRTETQALEAFSLQAHDSLEVPATAYTLANEIRNFLRCDRVGTAVYSRGACRLAAVSGQDRIDSRANAVRRLEAIALLCARTGEPILCNGAVEESAPEIKQALYEYLQETHAKQLLVVPLVRPARTAEESEAVVVGALTVECFNSVVSTALLRSRLERVTPHAGLALANALDFEWPVLPAVGRAVHRSRLRRMLKNTKLVAVLAATLTLVIGLLVFYPTDFNLQAPGKLQPVVRREVFAETEGTVHRVHVKHGQDVKRGELLVELVDYELNVAEAEVVKQIQETTQEIANTERELNDAQRAGAVERGKITARRATAVERLRGLRAQAALYTEKRRRLQVVSPIDGRVATWNVAELLMMRPVRPGQVLLSVADPGGDWELEVRLPERRLGH